MLSKEAYEKYSPQYLRAIQQVDPDFGRRYNAHWFIWVNEKLLLAMCAEYVAYQGKKREAYRALDWSLHQYWVLD